MAARINAIVALTKVHDFLSSARGWSRAVKVGPCACMFGNLIHRTHGCDKEITATRTCDREQQILPFPCVKAVIVGGHHSGMDLGMKQGGDNLNPIDLIPLANPNAQA